MRLGRAMAAAEDSSTTYSYFEKFTEMIHSGLFMPGGRIWYGAGRPVQALLNCFVIPTEDSMAGWGKTVSDLMQITALGGGVGMNLSAVRGKGFSISRGGESTGAVSLGIACNSVGDVLRGGGGRRIAMMQCLNVDHPDINEFISAKVDRGQLNNANISIVIPPHMKTDQFVRAIQLGGGIPLQFAGRTTGHKNAAALWEDVVQNAWLNGEPGVLNGYLANQQSNIRYRHSLISTNPCGEIWLPAYGCCCLGALVLPRFVNWSGGINWRALAETIHLAVRFLDNVLTVNDYPLPEIQRMCQGERRIGLGVMGLHSMLLDLGMQYDSPEAFKFVDKLFSFIKEEAYAASTQLAKEKGPFAFYSSELLNSGFAKTLDPSIRKQIKTHGLRNCAVLTIAPTGTTSEVMDVSGGIEPLYAPVHIRRRWKGEVRHEELVISKDYLDHPEIVQGAHDISPRQHFEMQRIVQAHVDNAVSKTINLPTDFPVHSLSDLWLEYLPSLKGTTFYREGSRDKEPLKSVPVDLVQEVSQSFLDEGKPVEMGGNYVLDCVSGACTI